jgi:type II secretory ATPase GspE/PulE/Tfp pilus assembly ATPase PilB-like protein
VRTVCTRCKEPYQPPIGLIKAAGLEDRLGEVTFTHGKGCSACNHTGYRGRTALFELMNVTEEIREAILNRPSAMQLYELARESGLRSLYEAGVDKALAGITTLEEVARVTQAE